MSCTTIKIQTNTIKMKVETVYDRCKFFRCNNGRHNGHHLFRFPKDSNRLKLWVENSGNILLRNWLPSSLRTAGLCKEHFYDKDFSNEKKTQLRRNRHPMHWKEWQLLRSLKEQDLLKQSQLQQDVQVNTKFIQTEEKHQQQQQEQCQEEQQQEIQMQQLKLQQEQQHQEKQQQEKQQEQQQQEKQTHEKQQQKYQQQEQQQQEKQEQEMQQEQPQQEKQTHEKQQQKHEQQEQQQQKKQEQEVQQEQQDMQLSIKCKMVKQINEEVLDIEDETFNEFLPTNTYSTGEGSFNIFEKNVNGIFDINCETDKNNIVVENVTSCSTSCKINVTKLNKRNFSLDLKLKKLRANLKAERMKIFRLRKNLYKEKLKRNQNIDDFLINKDIHPLSKTLIKLQLHTKKSSYTDEEKEFAKNLYSHSATHYSYLRNIGLHLPSESTARAWISESKRLPENSR